MRADDVSLPGRTGRCVVLASRNPHKVVEIAAIFASLTSKHSTDASPTFELVGLDQFPNVVLPPEDGETFEQNALGKAAAAAQQTGMLAIGDDSGLEVEALGGAPGVRSARFAGVNATDEENLELLLEKMKHIPDGQRQARFVCALAVALPNAPSGLEPHILRASVEGQITRAPRGTNGFGYDPVFELPGRGLTTAEITPAEKNALSHRGQAVEKAFPIILELLQRAGV